MTQVLSTEVKSISDRIKDKVVGEFLNIITDAEWTSLIEGRIKSFTACSYSHTNGKTYSELENMVDTALREVLKDKIKRIIENLPYVNNETELEGLILKMTESIGKGAIDRFLYESTQVALSAFRQTMAPGRY